MIKNLLKYTPILFFLLFLTSCGFTPMYKVIEGIVDIKSYSVVLLNQEDASREIKEEIRKSFPATKVVNNFLIEIKTSENLDSLITNTDGTIAKYRIEIILNFKVKDKRDNSYLMEDTVRGFAQYTVETSEIESDDKKKRMVRTATSSAIQMMISKIQSDTSITNDN